MKSTKRMAGLLIGAVCLQMACAEQDTQPNSDISETDPSKVYPVELPVGADNMDCEMQPEAPALCDWVGSTDAIVWGRLEEVRMVPFPAVLSADPSQVVTECSRSVDGALELVLSVEEVYHGTPPETLTIRVGHHQLDEWSPTPALSNGETIWFGEDGRLKSGDHIGAAVHRSASGDMWGLLGEVLFGDSADGSLVAQERSFCQEPAPLGLVGLSRAELGDAVLACPTDLSDEALERARIKADTWSSFSYAFAGMCYESGQQTSD